MLASTIVSLKKWILIILFWDLYGTMAAPERSQHTLTNVQRVLVIWGLSLLLNIVAMGIFFFFKKMSAIFQNL
jgi:hypothetical protein